MIPASWFARHSLRLTRLGLVGAFAAFPFPFARAELLFEHHQGGPAEYRDAGLNHAGEFQVTEAIRIQAVAGWFNSGGLLGYDFEHGGFNGPAGLVGVSISDTPLGSPVSIYSPGGPIDYFATFHLAGLPAPPPGQPALAGAWTTFGGLQWDLTPGTYSLNFFGASMPLAYGYFGPTHNVPDFDAFFYNFSPPDTPGTDFPFGMRIHGRALSAVPEASAYGAVAAALLVLSIIGSRGRPKREPSI